MKNTFLPILLSSFYLFISESIFADAKPLPDYQYGNDQMGYSIDLYK